MSREFGRLVTKIIKCIAAHEEKLIRAVEQEIGTLLGFSVHTVQGWRRGNIPPDPEVVRQLAEIGVRRGRLELSWLRRFLAQARYSGTGRLIESLAVEYGQVCEFLDDRYVSPAEIFKQVQEYVFQAESRVWILNSHPRESPLEKSLQDLQSGAIEQRILALEKLVTQHAYYEQLIRRAALAPRGFEYVRIVQVPQERHPEISPETTGYHYLYHFYRMLKKREIHKMPGREINVLLYAGSLLRNTTFAVIDEHTLLIQITGLQRQQTGPVSYDLRGLLVIRSEARPSVVTQFADLFDYIRKGHEGQVANVSLAHLERFRDQIPPLDREIVNPLGELLDDLWSDEQFDHFVRAVRVVYQSNLSRLRQVLVDLMPQYQQRSQWPLILNVIGPDLELREFLDQRPSEIIRRQPQAYALVVGINAYQNLRHLRRATKDATDIRHKLTSGGYKPENITLLLDDKATRSAISDTLDRLSRRARPEDLVFIFLSCHGAQRVGGFGPGVFLCPVEADLHNLQLTAISSESFTKALNSIKAKMMICLDASHSGGMGRIRAGEYDVHLALPPETCDHWTEEGRLILASIGSQEPSWELSSMSNGLFAHCLLKGIQEVPLQDEALWGLELAQYASRQVVKHNVQRPFIQFNGNNFPVLWPTRKKEGVA